MFEYTEYTYTAKTQAEVPGQLCHIHWEAKHNAWRWCPHRGQHWAQSHQSCCPGTFIPHWHHMTPSPIASCWLAGTRICTWRSSRWFHLSWPPEQSIQSCTVKAQIAAPTQNSFNCEHSNCELSGRFVLCWSFRRRSKAIALAADSNVEGEDSYQRASKDPVWEVFSEFFKKHPEAPTLTPQ